MTEEQKQWLRAEFERCKPWIQAALDRDIGTHNIDDVWDAIKSGAAQLRPTKNSVAVTTVEDYPRLKMLRGWLAGGDLDEIVTYVPRIEDWAIRQGCNLALIGGRRGWIRTLSGYKEAGTYLVKRL